MVQKVNKKECPSCAMDIDKDAAICPICAFEFPKRNPIYQWVAVALAILLLVLFIL